jgi:fimbrial isopeptide formation D2 family protein/LPXTG-motif cell wall-anchored protein
MKLNFLKRMGAIALSAALAASMFAVGASAADKATIDTAKSASITLYKYDMTAAENAGAWATESYVSTGLLDEAVNTALSGYAIQGVEFSYLKIADLDIFKESANGQQTVTPLYGFREDVSTGSKATVDFLAALGLTTGDAYTVKHDASQNRIWYFASDTLVDALTSALASNETATKAALEAYMNANGGTAMPGTDENGKSSADNLPQGLYLLVETKVPEDVVDTTAPFLVSLPMTTVDGSAWNCAVTVYPKNETGAPTLEKTVRESQADTGKNADYAHTATASDGDVVDYQIISTLPTITSPATDLTTYTFADALSKGIQYSKNDVKIEFFTDVDCTDLVTIWTEADGKFAVAYKDYDPASGSTMTISMTSDGLSEINSASTVYDSATSNLRGYSNLTMRITYSATINSDATTVYGDNGNPNEVTLTWKRTNTNYYDTLNDDCHVYTYGLDLTKEFSDNAGNFSNVKFLLKNATDNYYVQAELSKSEGIYYVTGHTTKEAEATLFSPMSGEVNHGKILVKGLEDDSYIITEVATDSGYTLLKENIDLEITSGEGKTVCDICGKALLTATAKVNDNTVEMTADNESASAIVPLTVTNTKGFDLPKTGGNGSKLFYALGILAMVAAGASIAAFFRKASKK